MTTRAILPRALRPGDTVAVVAPSGKVDPERLASGIEMLRSWGYFAVAMPSTESGRGYLAGPSDEANGAELASCFADSRFAGILCARGGYGAMRVLPHIDWSVVRGNPKLLLGYSDITALHMAIRREAGLATFHGSMIARQGDEPALHPWTAAGLRAALASTKPLGAIRSPEDGPRPVVITPGSATGPLAGGNLTLVASLIGTPWQLDARGCVLLLEDVNEAPYRIDRMLTQLLLSGALSDVAGIVFGDSPTCDRPADDPRTMPLATVLRDRLGPLGVPVVYGFPCGHTPFRATLPMGVDVTLDVAGGTLTVLQPACV